jgi:hypothetical protein
MSELIFVTSENCELCKKAREQISFLEPYYRIQEIDVQEGYQEYLLRVPVLLKNEEIIDEGIFSKLRILKNLIF